MTYQYPPNQQPARPPQAYPQYPPDQQPAPPPQAYPPYPPNQQPGYPPQAYQQYPPYPPAPVARRKRKRLSGCCSCMLAVVLPFALLFVFLLVYLFAPLPIDFLLLGIDRVPDGTALGRSDTIILVSTNPLTARVKMLSIPRDLWVNIPGVGENRINTAHFFAEANQPGSGPEAAAQTVEQNFGVPVPYTLRLRFDAVLRIVDAMGGVTVNLPEDMAGLPAGSHHLNGEQALAFVRDRKGADDFFRMEHGQVMLKAITLQALSPDLWPRLPDVLQAGISSVDTNLPAWQFPRLGFAFLRAAVTGSLDARSISREMATPYTTDGGASVLLPNWELINPYVQEMFPR